MNEFQKDLLQIRSDLKDCLRKELMGPGSEISYPDEAHELISESPSERYSVGILYTQQSRYSVSEIEIKAGDSTEVDDDDVGSEEEYSDVGCHASKMYKDDAFDEEVNLAQQNKPSSMGLTFFIDTDIEKLALSVDYAKYAAVKDEEVEIPFNAEELYIPDVLSQYIEYDKEKKVLRKKSSIKYRDLQDLFELNAIENPELFDVIRNLNQVFRKGRAYRRNPYSECITLTFDGTKAECSLEHTKGSVTAVKHNMGVYTSITIMLVNDEKDKKYDYIYQPKITVKSDDNSFHFVSYNHFIDPSRLSEEEKSLELLYRNKFVFGTGHGVAVDWEISDGEGVLYTEYIPTFEVPKTNMNLRRETEEENAVAPETLSMKYLSDLDKTDRNEKLNNIEAFINCYKAWIEKLKDEANSNSFDGRFKETALKHIEKCLESFNRMTNGIAILRTNPTAYVSFALANRAMFMQRIHGEIQKEDHYPDDEKLQREMAKIDYIEMTDGNTRWRPFQLAFLIMSINSIIDPNCKERDIVDLIWFPTGGGKRKHIWGLLPLLFSIADCLTPKVEAEQLL